MVRHGSVTNKDPSNNAYKFEFIAAKVYDTAGALMPGCASKPKAGSGKGAKEAQRSIVLPL